MLLSRRSEINRSHSLAVIYSIVSIVLFVLLLIPTTIKFQLVLPVLIVTLCLSLYYWLNEQRLCEMMESLQNRRRFRDHYQKMNCRH